MNTARPCAASTEARALGVGEAAPHAAVRTASPEYFRASGIPLLGGREFTSTDRAGSGLVVIVNKTFADKFFPGEDPIGKRIAWTGELLKFSPISGDWRTIVGVAGNTRDGGLDAEPRATVFMPFAQMLSIGGALVIRADADAPGLVPAATRIVHRIAPMAPIVNVLTLAQIKDQSVAPRRLNAALVSSFGILAVVIAAVGIAGVLAFSVSARTNEIGIRMSLGAGRGQVQRMILREGGVLLVIGLMLGVAGAYLAGGVIRGLLFGVAPHDPVTLVGVAVAAGLTVPVVRGADRHGETSPLDTLAHQALADALAGAVRTTSAYRVAGHEVRAGLAPVHEARRVIGVIEAGMISSQKGTSVPPPEGCE